MIGIFSFTLLFASLLSSSSSRASALQTESIYNSYIRRLVVSPDCFAFEYKEMYYDSLGGTLRFATRTHPGVIDITKFFDYDHKNCLRYDLVSGSAYADIASPMSIRVGYPVLYYEASLHDYVDDVTADIIVTQDDDFQYERIHINNINTSNTVYPSYYMGELKEICDNGEDDDFDGFRDEDRDNNPCYLSCAEYRDETTGTLPSSDEMYDLAPEHVQNAVGRGATSESYCVDESTMRTSHMVTSYEYSRRAYMMSTFNPELCTNLTYDAELIRCAEGRYESENGEYTVNPDALIRAANNTGCEQNREINYRTFFPESGGVWIPNSSVFKEGGYRWDFNGNNAEIYVDDSGVHKSWCHGYHNEPPQFNCEIPSSAKGTVYEAGNVFETTLTYPVVIRYPGKRLDSYTEYNSSEKYSDFDNVVHPGLLTVKFCIIKIPSTCDPFFKYQEITTATGDKRVFNEGYCRDRGLPFV